MCSCSRCDKVISHFITKELESYVKEMYWEKTAIAIFICVVSYELLRHRTLLLNQ